MEQHIEDIHNEVEIKQEKSLYLITSKGSLIKRYQDSIVGSRSISKMIYYELCILLSRIPGAIGLFLRKIFWPRLFASCGSKVFFGENIIIRHPNRIHLGNRVVISDGCILDARTPSSDEVIVIKDDVILSNNVTLSCKGGSIKIGTFSGLGIQTIISSGTKNPVSIGNDVFVGPKCYITGGGDYNTSRLDIPIWRQGRKVMGGAKLENDIWLGANVTVLGGVKIGSQSIIGAGAVVTKSIPEKAICTGVPAKIIKYRERDE